MRPSFSTRAAHPEPIMISARRTSVWRGRASTSHYGTVRVVNVARRIRMLAPLEISSLSMNSGACLIETAARLSTPTTRWVDLTDDADLRGQYLEFDFSTTKKNGKGTVTVDSLTCMDNDEVPRPCRVTLGSFDKGTNTDASGKKICTFGGNVGPPPSGAFEVNWHEGLLAGSQFHTNDIDVLRCEDTGSTGPQQPGGQKGLEVDTPDFLTAPGCSTTSPAILVMVTSKTRASPAARNQMMPTRSTSRSTTLMTTSSLNASAISRVATFRFILRSAINKMGPG